MSDDVMAGGEPYADIYEAWESARTDAERLGRRFQLEMATNDSWSFEDISTDEYQELGAVADEHGLTEDDIPHVAARLFDAYRDAVSDTADQDGPAYGHLIDHVVAEGLDHQATSETTVYGEGDELDTDQESTITEADWPTELSRYVGEQEDLDGVVRTWFSIPHLEAETGFQEAQAVTPAVTYADAEQAIEQYHAEGRVPSPGLGVSGPRPPDRPE